MVKSILRLIALGLLGCLIWGFNLPPLLTLCLTKIYPGFALYPKERALSSLVGLSILTVTGSFRHRISLCCHNGPSPSFGFFQASLMYLYIPLLSSTVNILYSEIQASYAYISLMIW